MNREQALYQLLDNINDQYYLVYTEKFDSTSVCSLKITNNNFEFELFITDDIKSGKELYRDMKALYAELTDEQRQYLTDEFFVRIKDLQIKELRNEIRLNIGNMVCKKDIYNVGFISPDSTLDEGELFSLITEVLVENENNN